MRLLRSELVLHWVSLLLWCLALAAVMVLLLAFYPSVRDNPGLDAIYADLPPSAQALLGGSDLTSPAGYLSTQAYAFFLPVLLLVFGLGRAAASIAGEEEGRTLDLLLAQPVPRWSAYLQKAAAVVVGLVLLGVATWLPLALFGGTVSLDLPVSSALATTVQLTLFAVALSLWAQAISAALGHRGIGLAVVSGYTFLAYLVFGLSDVVPALARLKPLSLWRWYQGNDPLRTGFATAELAVLIGTAVVAVVVGTILFGRRDLHA